MRNKILYYVEYEKEFECEDIFFIDNEDELVRFLKETMDKIIRDKLDYFEIKKIK